MEAKVPCLVCENFRPEVERFLREESLEDRVDLRVFPTRCQNPGRAPKATSDPDPSPPEVEPRGKPIIVGGTCVVHSSAPGGPTLAEGGCFEVLAPDWLLRNLLVEGAFLVSPAWLAQWERHVGAWGFRPDDLRDFARESMRSICLLDTLVLPGVEAKLPALSAALGLPAQRIPLGMDWCRAQLRRLIGDRLGDHFEARPVDTPSIATPAITPIPETARRPEADYAMALDLLSRLNLFQTEGEVIRQLLDIFSMLFAPGEMTFLRYAAQSPVALIGPHGEERPLDEKALALCTTLAAETAIRDIGTGLALPLDFQGKRLGLVMLDAFAMPGQRSAYRNLLESIVPICSLSVNNAHNFEAIKRNEEMLRNRQEELQGMLAVRSRLFSIIGHDLRGPIGGMRDALGLLVEDAGKALDGNNALMLTEVHRSSENIFLLLTNLLDWGRSQQEGMELRPEDLAIGTLVDGVFALLQSQAAAKKVELRNDVAEAFRLTADANTMQTILRNLVSNALKYTRAGGIVTVKAAGSDGVRGGKRIEVADTGIGMKADKLAQALDFSVRSSSPGTAGERGTGLGLVLCGEFVRKNGGIMRLESEAGVGTRVVLDFEG